MTIAELAQVKPVLAGKLVKYMSNVEAPNVDNIHDEVPTLNKMVKDPNCPNNLKNRFYNLKHKYILRCIERKLVVKVVEFDGHYGFHLFNGHSYHQPKVYFPVGLHEYGFGDVEKEEYLGPDNAIDFDENTFNDIMMKLIMWLG